MIEILLTAPAFALFESVRDVPASMRYRDRIVRAYYPAGAVSTIAIGTDESMPTTIRQSTAVWVTPGGYSRVERRSSDGHTFTEIITPEERITFVDPSVWGLSREPRGHDPITRTFDRIFGHRYPREALALLNPFLMTWDYVCDLRLIRRTSILGHPATISRYTHRPDVPIPASDDAERLGSVDVEVILADDAPILLGWDALDHETLFEQSRLTSIDLEATFDDDELFTPESALRRLRPSV